MSMTTTECAASVVAEIAGRGLRDRAMSHADISSPDVFRSALEYAARQRVIGLMLPAIDAGELTVDEQQRLSVVRLQVALMERCIALDRELVRISTVLDESGLEHRVVKGVAHALTLYDDPAQRSYGDIDLLVRGADIEKVIKSLAQHGVTRPKPELRPGYDRRFGKGVTLRGTDWFGVDVHRTLAAGPYAMTVKADELFDEHSTITIGDRILSVLTPSDRLINACFNAAISDERPNLLSQRDVVSAALRGGVDTAQLLERTRGWQAQAVIARAITMSWTALHIDRSCDLHQWASTYQPSGRDQRYIACYREGSQRWAREALTALPVVPGISGKASYLRAVLLPTKEAAKRRRRSRMGRLVSGVRLVLRRPSR